MNIQEKFLVEEKHSNYGGTNKMEKEKVFNYPKEVKSAKEEIEYLGDQIKEIYGELLKAEKTSTGIFLKADTTISFRFMKIERIHWIQKNSEFVYK